MTRLANILHSETAIFAMCFLPRNGGKNVHEPHLELDSQLINKTCAYSSQTFRL